MKYYLIIVFLSTLPLSIIGQDIKTENGQNKFGQYNYYENEETKVRLSQIVRTDTVYEQNSGLNVYRSFDKFDTLVLELKYNMFQSDTRRPYLTRNVYNRKGMVVVYELFNMEGDRLDGIQYEYNSKGLLTKTEKLHGK